MNIIELMNSLAETRPAFHSEADFQFAFAWKFQEQYPNAEIRLEYPVRGDRLRKLDIFAVLDNVRYGIELKYKTCRLDANINNEPFSITEHAAQPGARYDYLKDIQRLETFKYHNQINVGYAIFLTNNRLYWEIPTRNIENTSDFNFRIHERRHIHNQRLSWAEGLGNWIDSRREDISIQDNYTLNWRDYSEIENQIFRYLCVETNN